MVSVLPHVAYIGLGSNLGRRKKNIAAALNALQAARDIEVDAVSPLYETEPVGGPDDQALFINAAARLHTSLAPHRLLAVCLNVEETLGRKRVIRWGPRTIDIDILLFDDQIIDDEELTIPHPDMHRRRFVMEPLCDIAPDLMHPTIGESMQSLREACD